MSQKSDTMLQLNPPMQSKHGMTGGGLAAAEENRYSVSSTAFGSWERFKGELRGGLGEWPAEVVLGERPARGALEEIGQEGSMANASRDGDRTESLGCEVVVENSGLVVPKPRYPLLRHTSAPSIFGANLVERCPKPLLKGDRRAHSLSINSINSIFPFPQCSRNSPETWLPCPQIPRNNPIISYFEQTAPRPKIPHLVNVTGQPRDSTSSFPSERGWWNYFYRSGGTSSHATAQNREETTIRAPELVLPLVEHDQWSMDVEAANTPHTPLTEKALMKHQKRLKYKARIFKLRLALQRAWSRFVDCFFLIACAIWWFISGCGCGLFGR